MPQIMSYTPCEWRTWDSVEFELNSFNTSAATYRPGVAADTYRLSAQPPGIPDVVRICKARPSMSEE